MRQRLKRLLLGGEKNPLDPRIFQHISLVAFLAWVGIGADGLSSANYGPEEAFLALGSHRYLAFFLALATAITVIVISMGYSQVIELFPQGGGGYLVTTRLLGKYPGLVAGSALVVDYVLTISISIASCGDALFSFLPVHYQPFKLTIEVGLVLLLIFLNLRGVKESVMTLMPIFLAFLVTHVLVLVWAFLTHAGDIGATARAHAQVASGELSTVGFLPLLFIFLRAYGMGAGTYTGIEAVSNSMHLLQEPRVETGKRTMTFMAISLSTLAGGILLAYLLFNVQPEEGRTLNATLIRSATMSWNIPGLPMGEIFSTFTLASAACLLFVAAQAGFMGGPGVLSYMSLDSWVPKRFTHLSDRLVTKYGILVMGLAALIMLIYAKGSVRVLVVMYSINVFMDFCLALTGMTIHRLRAKGKRWVLRAANTAVGAVLCSGILVTMIVMKFTQGAWVTMLITGVFMLKCMLVHKHYDKVQLAVHKLDDTLRDIPFPAVSGEGPRHDPDAPTAAMLVTGFNGLGIHSMLAVQQLFRKHFKNFVFISCGTIDSSKFKGSDQIDALKANTEESLQQYKQLAAQMGLHADYRYALGTHPVEELVELSQKVVKEFRHVVFFAGQMVFQEENMFSRLLHNQTTIFLQKRFRFSGLPMVILPIRVRL